MRVQTDWPAWSAWPSVQTGWLVALCLLWTAGRPAPAVADEREFERGKELYVTYCSPCHGLSGDGAGPAARHLDPRPRDFRSGQYKIRSTESGELPTDADLLHTITRGIPGTWMPAWDNLREADRLSLVIYIKSFSPRFERAGEERTSIDLGDRVPYTRDSADRGRQVYEKLECAKCHGMTGRGDGPSAADLVDERKRPIRVPDLTQSWKFRGGNSPEDLYKRFTAGLAGTPMPSVVQGYVVPDRMVDIVIKIEDGEALTPEEQREYDEVTREIRVNTWHLANYVQSLARGRGRFAWLLYTNPEDVRPWDDIAR